MADTTVQSTLSQDADTYFAFHPNGSSWQSLNNNQKQHLLDAALADLNSLADLPDPMTDAVVRQALFEQALFRLTPPENGRGAILRESISGAASEEYAETDALERHLAARTLFLLRPYLHCTRLRRG